MGTIKPVLLVLVTVCWLSRYGMHSPVQDTYYDGGGLCIQKNSEIGSQIKKLVGLRMGVQNIRSINKNWDSMSLLLESLDLNLDFICLSETWGYFGEVGKSSGYDAFNSSKYENRASGASILVKKSLNAEILEPLLAPPRFIDVILVKINMNDSAVKNLVIGSVYRSPRGSFEEFIKYWEKLLVLLSDNKMYGWIAGDFNIDIGKHSKRGDQFNQICNQNGFRPFKHGETRKQGLSSSTIDICVTNVHKNSYSFSIDTGITDHCTVICSLDIQHERLIKIGDYKNNVNYKEIINELSKEDFSEAVRIENVEQAIQKVIHIIQDCMDRYTQDRKQYFKYDSPNTPWMTKAILNSYRKKRKLYSQWRKHPRDEMKRARYNNYRNTLTGVIRKAKQNYYRGKLEEAKGDSRRYWKIINDLRDSKGRGKLVGPERLSDSNGSITTDPKQMADTAANYLTKAGDLIPNNTGTAGMIKRVNSTIFIAPVTCEEMTNIIKSLKKNTAVGYDRIPAFVIKELPNIIPTLTLITNQMISQGIFPDCLKTGIVKLKYKHGDKSLLSSYRPITILSTFSKIFEKVIKRRIDGFIAKFKLVNSSQYGFQAGLSTEDAILALTSKIKKEVSTGKVALAMSFDIKSAFDSVSHHILGAKLDKLGFRGVMGKILKTYLSNRALIVEVQGEKSIPRIMKKGLPQGSILGPTLFCLFINDIYDLDGKGEIVGFADDNLSVYITDDPIKNQEVFRKWLEELIQWYIKNGLELNLKKCHIIAIGSRINIRKLKDANFEVVLNNKWFKLEESIVYLGIILDEQLNWKQHIAYVLKKNSYFIPMFYRLRALLDTPTLMMILKTTLIPSIQYGLKIFGNGANSLLDPLHIFMKKVLRIILYLKPRDHVECLFKQFNILPIKHMYIVKLISYVIKVQKGGRNNTKLQLIHYVRSTGTHALREKGFPILKWTPNKNDFDKYHINNRIIRILNYVAARIPNFINEDTLEISREKYNPMKWIWEIKCEILWSKF